MAERRRTPRSYFGLSATPQPGLQEPALSPGMQQRFDSAGLSSFLPYVNPWETVARSQDYRAAENQFQVQDAEERFIQRLQADPAAATTGLQKFLAEDPRLISSPMFRAYAVTQDRLSREQKPKTDPYALDAAEAGKEFLDQYNKDISSGVPQLDAFAAHRTRLAEAKKKSPEDERLTLSGTPKEEFDNLMAEYVRSQDEEPTDEEKLAFLPPGRKEYTEAEWADAYNKAKAASQQEAIRKIERFQQVYGDFYKLPGNTRKAASDAPLSPVAPQTTATPQNAPAAIPVPNAAVPEVLQQAAPSKSNSNTGFNFPTLGDDLPPTNFQRMTEMVKTAASNAAGNIARDPVGMLANFDPEKRKQMILTTPPTEEDDLKAWTDAKQTVRDYIDSLPGDETQKLKMLGSILAEQDVPMDSFFPKKKGSNERINATMALESGLRLYGKNRELPEYALQDAEGKRRWTEVARIVAQEEMAKKGLISSPNAPVSSGSNSTSAPVPVSSLDDIRKLPIGSSFSYKGQTRIKTSELK